MLRLFFTLLLFISSTNSETTAQDLLPHLDESKPYFIQTWANTNCPINLSHQSHEIKKLLQAIVVPEFERVIHSSLNASIPNAIQQADGINKQIADLQKNIKEEEQYLKDAEKIAREFSPNPSEPLTPCAAGEQGSYCRATERSHMAQITILINRGFLRALLCYKKNGFK